MRAQLLIVMLVAGSAIADEAKPNETTVEVVKPAPPPPPKPDPPKPAARDAFADYTGANPIARELFIEARRLQNDGKQSEGCARLTASWQQEEAVSTEVQLGGCREGEGKLAEARRMYLDAAKRSRESGFDDRAIAATERAALLDGKLSTVVIRLAQPIAPGTVVMVNDHMVATAPEIREGVDAGDVTITAKGPTGVTSTKTFRVFLHTTTNVDVPTLQAREGGRKPAWIAASVVLGVGGLIALGAGSGPVKFAGGAAIAAGIGVFLLAPHQQVSVVPMTTSSGGGVALVGRF